MTSQLSGSGVVEELSGFSHSELKKLETVVGVAALVATSLLLDQSLWICSGEVELKIDLLVMYI